MNFATGVFTGLAIALVFFMFIDPDSMWHKIIVKEGHGEYNSITGEFQFLPPCGKGLGK
jgi:hypothetical protein